MAGEWSRCLYGVTEAEALPFYDGRDFGAAGFEGGGEGSPARIWMKRGTDVLRRLGEGPPLYRDLEGEEELLPQQVPPHPVRAGDVVQVRGMGGGGYGDPRRRDRKRLLEDVADGLISPQRAHDVYGLEDGSET
jgi:N-methylhydantoinase B